MTYFFPFLSGSGLVFRGRPIFLSRIFSRVLVGYKACFVSGLIPALCMRPSTVLNGRFNSLHISSMVKPFIYQIYKKLHIENTIYLYRIFPIFYEKMCRIFPIHIDLMSEMSYTYSR